LRAAAPTIFLGSRGVFNFDLSVSLRDGAHHSGNWGGLLANPGTILANAIAALVDARGGILVEGSSPRADSRLGQDRAGESRTGRARRSGDRSGLG
jgi:acetylornithine deacetylase/succinyl-diaminopimelate desuccinylase-like protein